VRRALVEVGGKQVFGPPKSHAGVRMVWLPEFMTQVLEDHLRTCASPDPDALVFTTRNGTPLTRTTWSKSFARAAAKVGIPGTHFHDLRHAAATMATQSGATLTDTMARLGHASAKTALTYQHTSPTQDKAIARALGAAREARKP
jgi:integrase